MCSSDLEGVAVAWRVGLKGGLAEKPVKRVVRCHQISPLLLGDLPSQEIELKRSGLGDSGQAPMKAGTKCHYENGS